jgi:hypothetical protein
MRGQRGSSTIDAGDAPGDLSAFFTGADDDELSRLLGGRVQVIEPSAPLARTNEAIRIGASQVLEELRRRRERRRLLTLIDDVLGDVERMLLADKTDVSASILDRARVLAGKLHQPQTLPQDALELQEILFTWQNAIMAQGLPREWLEHGDPAGDL